MRHVPKFHKNCTIFCASMKKIVFWGYFCMVQILPFIYEHVPIIELDLLDSVLKSRHARLHGNEDFHEKLKSLNC